MDCLASTNADGRIHVVSQNCNTTQFVYWTHVIAALAGATLCAVRAYGTETG